MKTIELTTNIMCGACVAKVTASLNETVGVNNWTVDTQNPKKILTVTNDTISEQEVVRAVEKAGYKAQPVSLN